MATTIIDALDPVYLPSQKRAIERFVLDRGSVSLGHGVSDLVPGRLFIVQAGTESGVKGETLIVYARPVGEKARNRSLNNDLLDKVGEPIESFEDRTTYRGVSGTFIFEPLPDHGDFCVRLNAYPGQRTEFESYVIVLEEILWAWHRPTWPLGHIDPPQGLTYTMLEGCCARNSRYAHPG